MKAKFTFGVGSDSGKLDGLVFCNYRREGLVFECKYKYPTLTDNNHKLGSITTKLHQIKPSEDYKNDMRTYLERYNKLRGNDGKYMRSWVNLYQKLIRYLV